jgi:hypothetical protein
VIGRRPARRLYDLVYPRDTDMVRLVVFAMNLKLRRAESRCARPSAPAVRSNESLARTVSHLTSRETSGRHGTSPSFAA